MSDRGTKECPFCAETIKAAARGCRFCGTIFPSEGDAGVPAPAVASPAPPPPPTALAGVEAAELLTELVAKSLVLYEEDEHGRGRYRLLETVRQYAQDRLLEAAEAAAVGRRHRDWFLAMAEQADAEWHGPKQKEWFARLEIEHDNMRAALKAVVSGQWLVDSPAEPGSRTDPPLPELTTTHYPLTTAVEAGLRLGSALEWFWSRHGHAAEGRQWLAQALSRGGEASLLVRSRAVIKAGWLARFDRDGPSADALAAEGLALAREANDRRQIADSLLLSALQRLDQGEVAAAAAMIEEGLALAREAGEPGYLGYWLQWRGVVAARQGDLELAFSLHVESLALFRRLEHKTGLVEALSFCGRHHWRLGNLDQAKVMFQECLAVSREIGGPYHLLASLQLLGRFSLEQGEYAAAQPLWEECLAIQRELGHQREIAWALQWLGRIARGQGDSGAARARIEEGLAIFRELGIQEGIAQVLAGLGSAAAEQGEYGAARAHFEESLTIARSLEDQRWIVPALEGLAAVAVAQGQPERAARLFGAVERLREAVRAPLPPAERSGYEAAVARLRGTLGEELFATAWAQGRVLSLDEAATLALQEPPDA